MDIDQFFTVGPDRPFQAHSVFTNRETHLDVVRVRGTSGVRSVGCGWTIRAGWAYCLDSGGVDSGPPMLDLAWALAIDLPRGGAVDPLLDGYGRDAVDAGALDRLLPLMMARRLADVPQLGFDRVGAGWLAEWLDRHAPPVLAIVAPELGLQP